MSSSLCDITCGGNSEEMCGGFFTMTAYSIDCYEVSPSSTPYAAAGCYVDSNSSRVLPDGQTSSPMSTVVSRRSGRSIFIVKVNILWCSRGIHGGFRAKDDFVKRTFDQRHELTFHRHAVKDVERDASGHWRV